MPYRPVTVTTSPTMLAGYDAKRRSLSLFNNGVADVFFSQDQAVTTANGFVLKAGSGATLTREEGDEPEYALWAVVAGASVDVRVQEGLPEGRPEPERVVVVPGAGP